MDNLFHLRRESLKNPLVLYLRNNPLIFLSSSPYYYLRFCRFYFLILSLFLTVFYPLLSFLSFSKTFNHFIFYPLLLLKILFPFSSFDLYVFLVLPSLHIFNDKETSLNLFFDFHKKRRIKVFSFFL